MSAKQQPELDPGMPPSPAATAATAAKFDLSIKAAQGNILSPAQLEFNKRLRALEKARAALESRRAKLDEDLITCRETLMPLVEKRNQSECHLILLTQQTCESLKLTKRRSAAMEDLICLKLESLLGDPVGLCEEQTAALESLFDELDPPDADGSETDEKQRESIREEFEDMRAILEAFARKAGLNLDLEGLDPDMDPEEFDSEIQRRLAAESGISGKPGKGASAPKRGRKPSKAALERERLRKETEEAKKRDFKTLYKQLAKVLHPDLESDPDLKRHKETWMKRLTAANASGDLHAMLAIEIEWLGEESDNLAKATEEKLRVYSLVLKEQLDDIKLQNRNLILQPEYFPLRRFLSPYEDRLKTRIVRSELEEENRMLARMLASLRKGGAAARNFIHDTADHHARKHGF